MKKALLLIAFFAPILLLAQAPGCPNVTANVGAPITCNNPCTNLTANVFQTGQTTSYGVGAIPYAPPFPFTGGTSIFVGQDDIFSNTINIPFNFCFYGNSYNQCVIGANGLISFDLTNSGGFCDWSFTAPIPSGATTPPYHNSINGVYTDLDPSVSSGGDISYTVLGTAPCRTFVVSFHDIAMFSCNNLLTTQQIVLYETTNVIEVYVENYQSCAGWNTGNGLIGIQDATGANGIAAPGRNTGAWNATNEAWRFTPNGAPNYTFTWYDPGMNPISNNLVHNICPTASGNYTAEVVYTNCDGTQITETDVVAVNVSGNIPTADAGANDTTCQDANGNVIPVVIGGAPTATGGQGPYTYSWAPAAGLNNATIANPTASPNATTTYVLTLTDNNGCIVYDTVVITINNLNPPTMASTAETCLGANDGTATATPTNGTPGYTYSWNPTGQTTNPATNLPPGNYTVTVVDANGCGATNNVNVAPGPACNNCYFDSMTVAMTNCYSVPTVGYDVNGMLYFNVAPTTGTLTVTNCLGGTQVFNAPFASPLAFSFTNLPQNGVNCEFTAIFSADTNCADTVNFLAPTALSIPSVITDLTCFNSGDGQVVVAPQGGLPNYNYNWSVGGIGNNAVASNLSAGQLTVTITDANGCTLDSTFTVNEPAPFTFNTDSLNSNCFLPDGWAAVYNMTGGTGP